eukprot:c23141_g1_i1 orf=562-1986(-)
MAGNSSSRKRESIEQECQLQDTYRELGTDVSSCRATNVIGAPFSDTGSAEQQMESSSTPKLSGWGAPIWDSHEHHLSDRHVFHGLTPPTNVPSYLLGTNSLSPMDLGWQEEKKHDIQQTAMPQPPGAPGLACLDIGFESNFLSFTQCLQEGMNMGVTDYSDLSRSIRARLEPSQPTFTGFWQPDMPSSSISLFGQQEESVSSFSTLSQLESTTSCMPDLHSSFTTEVNAGCRSGEASTVPGTPNSSMSSSSSDGRDDELNRGAAVATECVGDKLEPDRTLAEMDGKPSTEMVRKPSKPRKKGQKRDRLPRIALVTKSDVEHLEDGYRWRKYGQKAVKNSPYPRSYYRCTHSKCLVKKRVERSSEDPSMVVTTYEGQHTHHCPAVLRGSSEVQFGQPRLSSFHQSPFTFPLKRFPMQSPILRSSVDLSVPLQDQSLWPSAVQLKTEDTQSQQSSQPMTDKGLLEDMLPAGVRKLP